MSARSPSPRRSYDDEPADETEQNPGNNLYVRGLTFKCTDGDMRELFSKYGEVVIDPHLQECRGFGFVTFATNTEAVEAAKGEDEKMFMGRRLTVELAKRAKARHSTPGEYRGPRQGFSEREHRGGFGGRRDDRGPPGGGYSRDRPHNDRSSNDRDDRYGGRGDDGYRGSSGRYDDRDRRDRGGYSSGDRDRRDYRRDDRRDDFRRDDRDRLFDRR